MSRPRRNYRRPAHQGRADIAGRALLASVIISLGLGFVGFDSFSVPSQAEVRHASAAVVFTGSFERVDAGLHIVARGDIPLLYISGLNAGAGILPNRFVNQFSQRNPNIADLGALVSCCVEWGELAADTFQNAQETKCWVERRDLAGALLLITSRQHMARSMIALSAALPSHKIIPYPIDDENYFAVPFRERVLEYVKYLATFVASRWPDHSDCTTGRSRDSALADKIQMGMGKSR